jgi:putative phosphoribosyl transferase
MEKEIFFKNRSEAGKNLAEKLSDIKGEKAIVFGLPRGGVPVAYEVAKYLNAELQALPVRKISMPSRQEVAIGAISFDDTVILNERYIELLNISKEEITKQVKKEEIRLKEMTTKFRNNKRLEDLSDYIAIIVDDGIATGYTAKVALDTLQKYNPKELILATPVIDSEVYEELSEFADHIVGNTVYGLQAISIFYEDFRQVDDEEVLKFLSAK